VNKKSSINLTVLAISLVACLSCIAIFLIGSQLSIDQFIGSNSKSARRIANTIIDYNLPPGYLEHGGRDVGIIKIAALTQDGQDPDIGARNLILLATHPSILGISGKQFSQELRLALLRSTEMVSTMEFVRDEIRTIRGENTIFEIYESFGEYDPPTRIVLSSVFPGKSENIILVFAGPISTWDQQLVDNFISSIK